MLERADPAPHTVLGSDGAVRSVHAIEVVLPAAELAARWTPRQLERLGAAYFHYLRRTFLGVVRAAPAPPGLKLVGLLDPIVLLRFGPARHELEAGRALVWWPIEGGLLAARAGRAAADRGRLAVEVHRLAGAGPGEARVRVELRVEGFRPAVAAWLGRRVYLATQARVHLRVAHGFLAKLPAYFRRAGAPPLGSAQPWARQ